MSTTNYDERYSRDFGVRCVNRPNDDSIDYNFMFPPYV